MKELDKYTPDGIDPMAFSVHAEYINRPATVIVDPAGIVRLACFGTYWGDRPSIEQTLEMIGRAGDWLGRASPIPRIRLHRPRHRDPSHTRTGS